MTVCSLAVTIEVDLAPTGPAPDLTAASSVAFGRDVGLSRVLDALAATAILATFMVDPATAARHPSILERIAGGGHEIGLLSSPRATGPDAADECGTASLDAALEGFARAGIAVVGHRAAAGTADWRMFELLAEHGFTYDSSLLDDDRPYVLATPRGDLVEIPVSWATDDRVHHDFVQPETGIRIVEPATKLADLVRAELDAQRRYGGCVVLTLNPCRSGRASRTAALRELISDTMAAGDVSIATLSEIAASAASDPGVQRRAPDPPPLELGPYS
jgi:peptidoglycan/xylan/chitin deacetylase (PgdA/CDA1 family)